MPSRSKPATLPDQMYAWIAQHRLLVAGEAIVVGVSGGPDSVAVVRLLRALTPRLPLAVTVAHIHHGIRGAAADRDQQFVEALAAQWGYPCVTTRLAATADAPAVDRDEESLREARYAALLATARTLGARTIAVGHTLDDQVETVLMRIIRGTGLQGLQGIPVERPLAECRLIRPLRGVWRTDVEMWLRAIDQPWCVDATNDSRALLRNRVRHELLPLLAAEYNPQIKHALRHAAETATVVWRHLEAEAAAWVAGHSTFVDGTALLPAQPLRAQPPALQQTILRLVIRRLQGHLRRLTYQHWLEVEDLLTGRPVHSVVDLPGNLRVEKETEHLIVTAG